MGVLKNPDGPSVPASSRFEWSDLRVFLYVVETGSLTAAARSLGLSQPTVSQRIRDLELRLNAQLFVRGPQGIALTEAGELIRDEARAMERSANAIDRLIRERDKREEGRVRLAAPDGVAAFWIAPRLADFQRLNPRVSLSLDAGLWPNDPLRDELDISLQYEETRLGDRIVQSIATVHYAPFASESYLSLYGAPRSLAEIASHRTIHHSAHRQQKETWDPKVSALQTLWDANLETNCSSTVVMAIQHGGGIGMMPTALAATIPGLVMLGDQPAASPKLWLVYHQDIARIARVRRVIEWLKDCFDPKKNPWFRPEFIHPREFDRVTSPDASARD